MRCDSGEPFEKTGNQETEDGCRETRRCSQVNDLVGSHTIKKRGERGTQRRGRRGLEVAAVSSVFGRLWCLFSVAVLYDIIL